MRESVVLEYIQDGLNDIFNLLNNMGLGNIPSSIYLFLKSFLPINDIIDKYTIYIKIISSLGFIKLLSKMINLKPKQLKVGD